MEQEGLETNLDYDEILQEIKRVFPGFEKEHNIETVEIIVSIVKEYLGNNGIGGDGRYIVIKQRSKYKKIFLRDIIFAETAQRKIIIHTKDDNFNYYGKMSELEEILGDGFFRTHRAYIVNLEYVLSFDVESVELSNGRAILSKAKYPDFVKAIKRQAENGK